ncbi:MAG: hypothetical protein LCH39_13675 [Proteobacteria bacterium]|nr:hypothetical protein [Pseudomonadota bacterium]
MARNFSVKASMVGLALVVPALAQAQSITPGANRNAPAPGTLTPPAQSAPATPATAQTSATDKAAAGPKATHAEVERKGRTGYDIFLGTYLTLSADCKVGNSPEITFPEPPKNGVTKIRTYPINLRDVPGAPKRTCIGTSPKGVAAIYQSKARFKGEDQLRFKVSYPNGDTREVSVKILVQ